MKKGTGQIHKQQQKKENSCVLNQQLSMWEGRALLSELQVLFRCHPKNNYTLLSSYIFIRPFEKWDVLC